MDTTDPTGFNNTRHFENALSTGFNNSQHFEDAFFNQAVSAVSESQQKAIELLLAGERVGKVAKKVGVDRSTLWLWRQDVRFSWYPDRLEAYPTMQSLQ